MFGRAFVGAVITGGVLLAPAAAFAGTDGQSEYPEGEYPSATPRMLCTPLFTPPGLPFNVLISGPEGGIATVQATNADGDPTFVDDAPAVAGTVTSAPKELTEFLETDVFGARFQIIVPENTVGSTVAVGFVDGVEVGTCEIGLIEVFSTPTPTPSESETSTPEPSESETSTPEPSEIVVVEDAPPGEVTTTGAVLSGTGFDGLPMAAGAAAVLLGGAAAVVIAGRRTASGADE
ncbi:hypothetical protein [Demequina mangrovi]|uniref:LPXTG-motif cell wall anchor domain-containing protein n=1 Tax=Demequina mangrovi TaxID=1043493 RepID=A0A1H6YV28_9MICO|nr:hypothetical protein [Demequina mangrovi]SEJ41120.1 hypothetical protein SAMN05421637_1762 [Demequina mangrovi]